ncbi:MAG: DNRLRE domain-containing protein [Gemmatimonadetes bacterium]|nr:DNRLRE domain-containing protein [Gemmatimonadota bacterium]
MDVWRHRVSLLAAATLLALGVAACGTQEDNSLGLGFIAEQGDFKAVQFFEAEPDTTDDFQAPEQSSNAGSSPSVTFGSQPGYLARTLIQFQESFWPAPGTVLDSARLCFSYDDGIGTVDTVAIGVHRVTTVWTEERIAPAEFPAFLPPVDTLFFAKGSFSDTVEVAIDSLAQYWIDNPDSNLGVALVPTDMTDLMLEYASRNSLRPPVMTLYWNEAGRDTSVAVGPLYDNSVFSTTGTFMPLSDLPGRLTVGRGLPARSILRFPLPPLGDRATVHRATLTFRADQAQSSLNNFALRFQRVTEEPWAEDSTVVDVVAYGIAAVSAETDTAEFNIEGLIPAIVENGNMGILVRAHEDRLDTDYIRFHGADSEDPAKTPRLRIWYTPGDEVTP